MNLFKRAKGFFNGHALGKSLNSEDLEVYAPTPKEMNPPVASYINTYAPMSYDEMRLLVPREIWNPKHEKHKSVFGLFQAMVKFREDSRKVSRMPVDKYLSLPASVPKEIHIRGIQEQMGAIRYRLDNADYAHTLEMEILKNRLLELYQVAKEIDPVGTTRYERHIDKQIRKSKVRT